MQLPSTIATSRKSSVLRAFVEHEQARGGGLPPVPPLAHRSPARGYGGGQPVEFRPTVGPWGQPVDGKEHAAHRLTPLLHRLPTARRGDLPDSKHQHSMDRGKGKSPKGLPCGGYTERGTQSHGAAKGRPAGADT
jgi:hypothetical protein